jgi:hypothetical protein
MSVRIFKLSSLLWWLSGIATRSTSVFEHSAQLPPQLPQVELRERCVCGEVKVGLVAHFAFPFLPHERAARAFRIVLDGLNDFVAFVAHSQ